MSEILFEASGQCEINGVESHTLYFDDYGSRDGVRGTATIEAGIKDIQPNMELVIEWKITGVIGLDYKEIPVSEWASNGIGIADTE